MTIATHGTTITQKSTQAATTKAMEKNLDGNVLMSDMNLLRKPEKFVWIVNVGPRVHKVCRPWAHPQYIIPGCKPGERYAVGNPIPDVVQEIVNPQEGRTQINTRGVDGRFYAADLINPDNFLTDWREQNPSTDPLGINQGTNLIDHGVFWTMENPPREEDLLLAEKNLTARYRRLVDEANSLAMEGPKGIERITAEHRVAADFFGLEFSWNLTKGAKSKIDCEGCGTSINAKAAVCPICKAVLDKEKAIRLGIIKE